jgi:ABC-type amino acid transport substrate-binding protein
VSIPHVILAPDESPFLASEEDLKGKTVALEEDFVNVTYFRKQYPEIKLKLYANTLMALEAVSRGQADAYVGNRVAALYHVETNFISNLAIHGRLQRPVSNLAIGVRKDAPILHDILQKALADISRDERRVIINRWVHPVKVQQIARSSLTFTPEEEAWLKAHPEIEIGVDGNWPPIDFMDAEGQHQGIAADYLDRMGKRLGVTFHPKPSPSFKQMLQKVMDGQLKVGATITRNNERAQKLLFTQPFCYA